MNHLNAREQELIRSTVSAVMEELAPRIPDLTAEQQRVLPRMIEWYEEMVEAQRLRREFYERLKLSALSRALGLFALFALLAVIFGGREAMQKIINMVAP
ncbi:MAG: hypothetical protein QJR02_07135 [Sinobacteraceae bacterium]|nr:hypothetical protein [Nevskiaceae bacterium]